MLGRRNQLTRAGLSAVATPAGQPVNQFVHASTTCLIDELFLPISHVTRCFQGSQNVLVFDAVHRQLVSADQFVKRALSLSTSV